MGTMVFVLTQVNERFILFQIWNIYAVPTTFFVGAAGVFPKNPLKIFDTQAHRSLTPFHCEYVYLVKLHHLKLLPKDCKQKKLTSFLEEIASLSSILDMKGRWMVDISIKSKI